MISNGKNSSWKGDEDKSPITLTASIKDSKYRLNLELPPSNGSSAFGKISLESFDISEEPSAIIISSSSSPTHSEDGCIYEMGTELSEEEYEVLRLCRNRAYAKVNTKRRQHLPASLSVYLHKEWLINYPSSSLRPKDLLSLYTIKFENERSKKRPSLKRKRRFETEVSKKNYKITESSSSTPSTTPTTITTSISTTPTTITTSNTSIKPTVSTWSPEMIETLKSIGLQNETFKEEAVIESSRSYHSEWIKIYPEFPLSEFQLRSKYIKLSTKNPQSIKSFSQPEIQTHLKSYKIEENPTEFSSKENGGNLCSFINEDGLCSVHWTHLFFDTDKNVECFLTEQLLEIRRRLQPSFRNCDIYKPKKPKGFAAAILTEWKLLYPNSEETTKSIAYKLSRFDKKENVVGGKMTAKGRMIWSQEMLNNLQKSRKIAESMIPEGKPVTAQAISKFWKKEWNKLYPELKQEWRTVMSRYNYHFSGLDSISLIEEKGSETKFSSNETEEDVKGFRSWTPGMKQGLLDTKHRILASFGSQKIDMESKQFSKSLLEEFRKLFPKTMESARSLLARLQAIGKEGYISEMSHNEKKELKRSEEKEVTIVKEMAHKEQFMYHNVDEEPEKKNEEIVKEENKEVIKICRRSKTSKSVKKNEICDNIPGFEDWNLSMIRDFIACMDTARRKYALLKEKETPASQGSVKLVPLLLNEWKLIYPSTRETVKTFLIKIKHLKIQKEVIKRYLGQSGLLPNLEGSHIESSHTIGDERFKWEKEMIGDVVQTRQIALELQEKYKTDLRKSSFHALWVQEFKKKYPNSPYNSNNLNVHFWNWRKEQEKVIETESLNVETKKSGFSSLTSEDKRQLLNIGLVVQRNLQASQTPNRVKLKGFINILHDEWIKARPDRSSDTVRGLNMVYSKLLKNGVKDQISNDHNDNEPNDVFRSLQIWTPKHNRTLRQIASSYLESSLGPDFQTQVLADWRSFFPHITISDDEVLRRLSDVESLQKVLDINVSPCVLKDLKDSFNEALTLTSESESESFENVFRSLFEKRQPFYSLASDSLLQTFYELASIHTQLWPTSVLFSMVNTRKNAIRKRKKSQSLSDIMDVWFKDFKTQEPRIKTTKAALAKRYRIWKRDEDKHSCIEPSLLRHISGFFGGVSIKLPVCLPLANCSSSSSSSSSEETPRDETSIQLPGGATLVALTEKNLDILYKTKSLEKPFVTITIEDKKNSSLSSNLSSFLTSHSLSHSDFIQIVKNYNQCVNEFKTQLMAGYIPYLPQLLSQFSSSLSSSQILDLMSLYGSELPQLLETQISPISCSFSPQIISHVLELFAPYKLKLKSKERKDEVYKTLLYDWTFKYPMYSELSLRHLLSIYHLVTNSLFFSSSAMEDYETDVILYEIRTAFQFSLLESKNSKPLIKKEKIRREIEKEWNVSLTQIQIWANQTQFIQREKWGRRPHMSIKNFRWTHEKNKDLLLCHKIASLSFKGRRSFMEHIHKLWKNKYPTCPLTTRFLNSKLIYLLRTLRSRRFKKNNEEIEKMNQLLFSATQNITISHQTEEEKEEDEEKEYSATKDEDNIVYAYINETQKSKRNSTWSSEVIRDLIEARSEARRRKREWEKEVIGKYGGVGVAYSNPNIKIQKVDDMFREEWNKRRPSLSHVSIWTLSSYARKFDGLKKQLVKNSVCPNNSYNSFVYYPESGIPKYDLESLTNCSVLSQEVKDLIISRQNAKEKQMKTEPQFSLSHLWVEAWLVLHPEEKKNICAISLIKKLLSFESNGSIREALQKHVRKSSSRLSQESFFFTPFSEQREEDSNLMIPSRKHLFPEDEETLTSSEEIPHRQILTLYSRGVYKNSKQRLFSSSLVSSNHGISRENQLDIPEVLLEDIPSEKIKLEAKRERLSHLPYSHFSSLAKDSFYCETCNQYYHNYNNYNYHMNMHETFKR